MDRPLTVAIQVDPVEKPKSPKGRANKRAVYTRRFVNVTMTGGKRRVRLVCGATQNFVANFLSVADEP